MKTGLDLNRAGALKPGATFEGILGLLARTDALRHRRMPAAGSSIDHAATRAVPLETILPFAILGGNALMHDYLSQERTTRSLSRRDRESNHGGGSTAGASFPAREA